MKSLFYSYVFEDQPIKKTLIEIATTIIFIGIFGYFSARIDESHEIQIFLLVLPTLTLIFYFYKKMFEADKTTNILRIFIKVFVEFMVAGGIYFIFIFLGINLLFSIACSSTPYNCGPF